MKNQIITHDERTTMVENASYRLAYLVMSFGSLLIVAYRGFVMKQTSWDLLVLVIVGGVVATLYQGTHQIISRRTFIGIIVLSVITMIIASLFALYLTRSQIAVF